MNDQQLRVIAAAEKDVTRLFEKKVNPLFVFHNLSHTQQVVSAVKEIVNYYQVDDVSQFILTISAWFHDAGYSSGKVEDHERESIKQAEDFLNFHDTDHPIIEKVLSCIQSTRVPQSPANLEEKIICDADMFHLGTERFFQVTDYLRKELETYYKKEIARAEWRQQNIDFLQSHKYFTSYCQQKLEPVKKEWIKILQSEG